jgi:predicted transcriptional regulator
LDIVRFVLDNPRATKEEIAEGIGVHSQATYRTLQQLETIGVLKPKALTIGKKGRPRHCFDINGLLLPALQPEKYFDEDILSKSSHPAHRPRKTGATVRKPTTSNGRRLPPRRT